MALALDACELGGVVLTFESRIGAHSRVGYHRGRWAMVTKTRSGQTAFAVDRDAVARVIRDSESVRLHDGDRDRAWVWYTSGGGPETTKGHCVCGAFKWSTNTNTVAQWAESHRRECPSYPTVTYPDGGTE